MITDLTPAPHRPSLRASRALSGGSPRRSVPRLPHRGLGSALLALALVLGAALPGAARAEGSRWQWPLPPPHSVIRAFEAPAHAYGPGHRGIDIAAAGTGSEVRAVEAGTVHFSGMVAGRGVVSVLHADGLLSTYEPVVGTVGAGETVEAGQVLGTLSDPGESTHCPGVACLHLGARRGQDYWDPMLLLGAQGPSVLLTWEESAAGEATSTRLAPGARAGSPAEAGQRGAEPAGPPVHDGPAGRQGASVPGTGPLRPGTIEPAVPAVPTPG